MTNEYENLPYFLKTQKRWVLWKKKEITDSNGVVKTTKLPIDAHTGYVASTTNEDTWCDFETAMKGYEYYKTEGIGYVLGNGVVGIDIDHCRNVNDKDKVISIVNKINSYTEISQSGDGIHILAKGNLENGSRRGNGVEIYGEGRFFALTGKLAKVNGIIRNTLEERHEEVNALIKELFKDKIGKYVSCENSISRLSDNEVIEHAINSANGQIFKLLYDGKWQGMYESQSNADLAFANYLAFWTNKDFYQMDRIFRQSGLYREKYDRKTRDTTYGALLLEEAIRATKDTYLGNDFINSSSSKQKKHYTLDDTGNAERLIDMFYGDIKYNYDNNQWLIYNGTTWENDKTQKIMQKADTMLQELRNELSDFLDSIGDKEPTSEDKAYINMLNQNIKRVASNAGKKAMVEEAKHLAPILNSDLNKDKYLLNTLSGVVNLKTGEITPHKKDLFMSRNTNIEVDMEHEPTLWLKYLHDLFDKEDVIEYIQKSVGYTLTGSTEEQCLFECSGDGSNGKSVFFNTITNIFGTYGINIQVDSILANKGTSNGGNANPDIARLDGCRFVRTNEPTENSRFNEGLVKQLTGGDTISARFLYGTFFDYTLQFKLWVACNGKIQFVGTDKGIKRRLRLIEFTKTFDESTADKKLEEKLEKEYPQILGWAIKGAIKWAKDGLVLPSEIDLSTKAYIEEMDGIAKFVKSECKEDKTKMESAKRLWQKYSAYCKLYNEYQLSQTKFGREMGKKYKKVNMNGYVYYKGLYIKESENYVSQ